jgi:Na+-driven multidrug efflux pump
MTGPLTLACFTEVANLGVLDIRSSLVADTISPAIIFIIYFKLGRWKHKKV